MNKYVDVSNRHMWGVQLVRSLGVAETKWLLSLGFGRRVVTYVWVRARMVAQ